MAATTGDPGGRDRRGWQMNQIYRIAPLEDPRWPGFVERHPRASVFHSREWLRALNRAYGYEPMALTTAAPHEELKNGVAFCQVQSWLTGRRVVSLPFSDHCQPLVENAEEYGSLVSALGGQGSRARTPVEVRSIDAPSGQLGGFQRASTFCLHRLNLGGSADDLFGTFHKDCVQRKVRRAGREELSHEEGRSTILLEKFYGLFQLTRRRQGLPPQPIEWFRHLMTSLGDGLSIWVASKGDRPVASIVTLRHKSTMVFKYGASDKRFASLGGTQLLLWKAIDEAKRSGLREFDMGRSESTNHGLIAFKDHWGAVRTELAYLHSTNSSRMALNSRGVHAAQYFFALAPSGLARMAGRILYRHFG